jgi:hypothetical protein
MSRVQCIEMADRNGAVNVESRYLPSTASALSATADFAVLLADAPKNSGQFWRNFPRMPLPLPTTP